MGLRLDLDDGTLPFHCRTTIKNHRYQWLDPTITLNGGGTPENFSMVEKTSLKSGLNCCKCLEKSMEIGKPSENYCCQWFSCEKTFNGNGREVTKPLENHRWQWCPGKIILPSTSLEKNDHRPCLVWANDNGVGNVWENVHKGVL